MIICWSFLSLQRHSCLGTKWTYLLANMLNVINKNTYIDCFLLIFIRNNKSILFFMISLKELTCHNQLGSLSEYHSDSVCTHGCTKTSWLSLMRGVKLKHPVETNFHCQHLVPFISVFIIQNTAGLEDWFWIFCCIILVSCWC